MKNLLFLLLICSSTHSHKQVYNVQQYCIDEKPFKKEQCDISGNEYSFVFVDSAKKKVTFFLTSTKLNYDIAEIYPDEFEKEFTYYVLENENGRADMRINRKGTKIEFIYPDKIIYLKTGKSTKLTSD